MRTFNKFLVPHETILVKMSHDSVAHSLLLAESAMLS